MFKKKRREGGRVRQRRRDGQEVKGGEERRGPVYFHDFRAPLSIQTPMFPPRCGAITAEGRM